MPGTIVCGVVDAPEGRAAAQMAAALSRRLGLRLVLAHVAGGASPGEDESLSARQGREGGERALQRIAQDLELDGAERRVELGDRAELLAQIAAEEGADLIVLGSRPHGLRKRHLRCTLARELEAATPAPVLVAPPQTRRRSERRLAVAEAAGAR